MLKRLVPFISSCSNLSDLPKSLQMIHPWTDVAAYTLATLVNTAPVALRKRALVAIARQMEATAYALATSVKIPNTTPVPFDTPIPVDSSTDEGCMIHSSAFLPYYLGSPVVCQRADVAAYFSTNQR